MVWTSPKRWFMCCKSNCEGVYSHFDLVFSSTTTRQFTHSLACSFECDEIIRVKNKSDKFVFALWIGKFNSKMQDAEIWMLLYSSKSRCSLVHIFTLLFICIYLQSSSNADNTIRFNRENGFTVKSFPFVVHFVPIVIPMH